MSSDDQFTAKGSAIVGFQTDPGPDDFIERGVDVEGSTAGVVARGPVAVQADGRDLGMVATAGDTGIHVTGVNAGVVAIADPNVAGAIGVSADGHFGVVANAARTGVIAKGSVGANAVGVATGLTASGSIGVEATGRVLGARLVADDKH